ncbi:retrovirus-related pol polyprotein from transposon TNT 1-94 [Tanacetum coccineum]
MEGQVKEKELVERPRFNDSLLAMQLGKMDDETYNSLPVGPIHKAILRKNITKKEDMGGNFVIPCNVGGLKYMDSLVDQGSDVNVMPLSNYNRLTNEKLVETDIRLSLDSQSHIYPLGTTKYVLVEIASYIYLMDFMILDIKEDKKRQFILGTPFLTTAKAEIRFDKGTITLKSGKNKVNFFKIPEFLCKTEERDEDDIDPVTPISIVSRQILEWEERVKCHLEKELEINQWRSKVFDNNYFVSKNEASDVNDEGGVTIYLMRRSSRVLRSFMWKIERVKSILLLAIPDEYLLKFHNVADAKSLWEAIKSRFGRNEESKKMQKNVLKHQFEIFSTASNESLDKAYDRFQKLISQLEVHGAPISKEYINQKFLRSLPLSWNQIALIMRNKPDIDEIDINDLYNNLRVYEDEMKRSSSSTSTSQNLTFLSSKNTRSTNEVSTASGDFGVSTAGGISQIDEDDLEELDLRWQVAMLTVRALVAQDGIGGYDWSNDFKIEPVNYALMAISSSSSLSSSDKEESVRALPSSLEERYSLTSQILDNMLKSPPVRRALSQGSRCKILRGCGFCEEVRILFPELIFAFPCELRTSLGVPSNFDDGNTT